MEQEDYLLREIEKIGMLLRGILNSLMHRNENLAITVMNPFEETKELLRDELNFELDKFVSLDESSAKEYLSHFSGMNIVNLELMADVLLQCGINNPSENSRDLLEKALQLYELCNTADKTFSRVREDKMNGIKKAMH